MTKYSTVCIQYIVYSIIQSIPYNIQCIIHTGILVIKKNKILTHASTWVNLESIMLIKLIRHKGTSYCVIPLTWDT